VTWLIHVWHDSATRNCHSLVILHSELSALCAAEILILVSYFCSDMNLRDDILQKRPMILTYENDIIGVFCRISSLRFIREWDHVLSVVTWISENLRHESQTWISDWQKCLNLRHESQTVWISDMNLRLSESQTWISDCLNLRHESRIGTSHFCSDVTCHFWRWYIYVERDVHIRQKRPTYTSEICYSDVTYNASSILNLICNVTAEMTCANVMSLLTWARYSI